MLSELVQNLSEATGIADSGLRFLLALLAGYPLAVIYRLIPSNTSHSIKSLYIAIAGLSLIYFCFGTDVIHSFITIVITYLLLLLIPDRKISLGLAFVFNLAYLLIAYLWYSTEEYDLNWTTPQCVLTLRLIGLSFDYFDGSRDPKELGAEEKQYRLLTLPSFIDILGFSYFFTAVLAGPQFTYCRYHQLLTEDIYRTGDQNTEPPSCLIPLLKCFLTGVLFLAVFNVGSTFYPTGFLKTDDFYELNFWDRLIYMWLSLKFCLYRYLGVWLITEGSSILTGIGYNGYSKDGKPQWNGVTNVNPWGYEFATNHQQVIDNFNINTNDWAKRYIFKRMKFANSRNISAGTTLFFLAVWHGFNVGYFICFGLEFIYMEAEKKYQRLTKPFIDPLYKEDASPVLKALGFGYATICWFGRQLLMHYAFSPFELKSFWLCHRLFASLYYFGHVAVLSVFVVDGVLSLKKPKIKKAD